MNGNITNQAVFNRIYIAIGLATPNSYDGVEYPQIIGIHTDPEVTISNMYPN
ncbi:hypothetical protein JCM21714_4262 [Gracilibacillus boraciitolerans JCM 21714]|uniref:Uncharacterized protein n=1 Tax=Gracilibacillus boraciitolerans JCM 21714 TaxID=1298598 RepID=W4VNU8_9BACI|nr:hypothetical protein [Gracilibacillus boraciitolerans]GAE95055.1 hypothetical protein JCM21714_4262 [Gracilibacillus boraciitolerans JCM 21714]